MKRIALIIAILISFVPGVPVFAQSPCELTVSPGLLDTSHPENRSKLYINETGADVQLGQFTINWSNNAVTLVSANYYYSNPSGFQNNTVYPGVTPPFSYNINDILVNTSQLHWGLTFSGDPGLVSFSYGCTTGPTPTPTATPTGTFTPPPTATQIPSPTPTATMTPTTANTGTVIATEPTGTPQPTATATETPNPVRALYNNMASIAPVWTPDPVSTPSINLDIPTIDINQVSDIALAVYRLLEQWHIFTTLLTIMISIAFLRWMYKFASRRNAPDPENIIDISEFIDADYSEIKSAWRNSKRRF